MKRLRATTAVLAIVVAGCGGTSVQPSAASPVDELLSDIELNTRMFECISMNGFDGVLDGNGSGVFVSFQVSPDRQAVFDQVETTCYADLVNLGLARGQTVTPSDADLRSRYDYLLEVSDCLRSEGVDVEPPPSLDAYISSAGTAWVPHSAVLSGGFTNAEVDRIFGTCPQ